MIQREKKVSSSMYEIIEDLFTNSAQIYEISEFGRKFAEIVHDSDLEPLSEVAQGLMRFLPSNRITADRALELLCDRMQEIDTTT